MAVTPSVADARRVLSIAGLDPTGGAGITADVRVLAALGVRPLAVATCLTVQDRGGLRELQPVEAGLLARTLRAAADDGPIDAVKVGLCGAPAVVEVVAEFAGALKAELVPVVVDPVLSASAGGFRADDELIEAYRRRLLPAATICTPNGPELARLAGLPAELLALGCGQVLLTGGHGEGPEVVDRLFAAGGEAAFPHPRLDAGTVHGTGCALSAALAAFLARGADVRTACARAIDFVHARLEQGLRAGKRGPTLDLHAPDT